MMKSKYNIQVCWYVHSDQSSRSLRVGHIRSIHPLDKVVWFGYAFMARLLIYFLLRTLCIPYFSNVTREVSGEINFLLYTRYGSKSMSRKKRDLEPRLRPQRLICTIIFINFFLFILFYWLLYVYLHKNYYSLNKSSWDTSTQRCFFTFWPVSSSSQCPFLLVLMYSISYLRNCQR